MIDAHAVDLDFISARPPSGVRMGIDLITSRVRGDDKHGIDINWMSRTQQRAGFIAGTADGIVSMSGNAVAREIVCLESISLKPIKRVWSAPNGHYLLDDLDPNTEYLYFARDYNREYEPVGYDYVKPSTALSIDEQRQLWQLWQTWQASS